jgi:putative membrane protein
MMQRLARLTGTEEDFSRIDADTATRLALDRTHLAHDRTLMAWVRTATSLVTFGFTVYKFFEFFAAAGGERLPLVDRLFGPRQFAMLLIGTGIIALALATAQHRHHLRQMRRLGAIMGRSLPELVAVLVTLVGVAALVAVLLGA